jgi:hypothetical protein
MIEEVKVGWPSAATTDVSRPVGPSVDEVRIAPLMVRGEIRWIGADSSARALADLVTRKFRL